MKKQTIFFNICAIILICLLFNNCTQIASDSGDVVFGDSIYLADVPPQPGQDTWKFIDDLKSPLWTKLNWQLREAGPGETDLSKGITIKKNFPDAGGRLETAYTDLVDFLSAGNIPSDKGQYVIETARVGGLEGEAFRLEISEEGCRIVAGDTEGIRRGIFQVEEEMLRSGGPFLPLATISKKPVVIRRISRCVYGPIKRPPAMRDELLDTVNYYPDNYLNRLAHEGVNGLWLTVDFRDLVATKFNPGVAGDAVKRFNKLQQTIDQCLRYGIRTYIFTIEPRAWGNRPPYFQDIGVLDKYPELGGVRRGDVVHFCPMSQTAQQYLYKVVNTIFSKVPDLGGIINISHGERTTTCASALSASGGGVIDCPRCSGKEPWEILHASLSAMEKGMHDAAPDAELISWHYMGTSKLYPDWVFDIPAHTPPGVILQFQFETGVTKTVFGRHLVGGDYWLATPGPSERFERQAMTAREHGTPVSAKIQTGNSHEVATTPYIPAPSLIYRKFSAMHRLGVSHTMLGWYFGNYPGLMIKSAGELSFDPFPESEDAFLNSLSRVYWKEEDVSKAVEAWKYFAEGYGNYPLQAMMGYYGPMHDGPVWPLLLKPADAPLVPTWQIGSSSTLKPWPLSGDRIGECLWDGGDQRGGSMEDVLTLKETVELCRLMSSDWDKGVNILRGLEEKYINDRERILDIGVARALGIQFRSGYNILRFYLLREEMLRQEGSERLEILSQLEEIVKEEMEMDRELLELCENDSRLGFHSEAEGYKYFPAKIRWRIEQLESVLENDFHEVEKFIKKGKLLFPEFTGKEPEGAVTYANSVESSSWTEEGFVVPVESDWQSFSYGRGSSGINWAGAYDQDALYIILTDIAKSDQSALSAVTGLTVKIEARRLWPFARYSYVFDDEQNSTEEVRRVEASGKKYVIVRIPLRTFWWEDEKTHPVRLDIRINIKGAGGYSWRPNNPVTSRLVFGTDNPADLGWLVFKE
jgi:hypothetical protein